MIEKLIFMFLGIYVGWCIRKLTTSKLYRCKYCGKVGHTFTECRKEKI